MTNPKYFQKLFLLVMGFSLSLVCACSDDENDEPIQDSDTEQTVPDVEDSTSDSTEDPSMNATDIAVTGLVDTCGCTYADICGYANLHQLPDGGGRLIIGIEINDGLYTRATNSWDGNRFTVSFDNLFPNTEYKYRSFVRFADVTYYASDYRTFTTKPVYNVVSTGDCKDATVSVLLQDSLVDERECFQLGVAYSDSRTALHPDSVFYEVFFGMSDVKNGECVVTLADLHDNTTYYYASFISFNGVYVFSDVKNFVTKKSHDWIDLGLSVKWATCNVGASSPEEYGGYYAWGETEEKSDYGWNTYKWCRGTSTSLTKYCTSSRNGTVDKKTVLDLEDDVAHVKWGGSWRMPTLNEIKELLNECTWKWTILNGVNGHLVTAPNGNSIFLPATGYQYGPILEQSDMYGEYWSATLLKAEDYWSPWQDDHGCFAAYTMSIGGSKWYWAYDARCYGRAVRPVTK